MLVPFFFKDVLAVIISSIYPNSKNENGLFRDGAGSPTVCKGAVRTAHWLHFRRTGEVQVASWNCRPVMTLPGV